LGAIAASVAPLAQLPATVSRFDAAMTAAGFPASLNFLNLASAPAAGPSSVRRGVVVGTAGSTPLTADIYSRDGAITSWRSASRAGSRPGCTRWVCRPCCWRFRGRNFDALPHGLSARVARFYTERFLAGLPAVPPRRSAAHICTLEK